MSEWQPIESAGRLPDGIESGKTYYIKRINPENLASREFVLSRKKPGTPFSGKSYLLDYLCKLKRAGR